MHRMEKLKMEGIINMLRYAQDDLAGEGMSGLKEDEEATIHISEAIRYMEKWESGEIDPDEITMAISMLQKALEEIPEDIPGDARQSVESAIGDLKEEEKAAKPGEGNFEAQL